MYVKVKYDRIAPKMKKSKSFYNIHEFKVDYEKLRIHV